MTLNLAHPAVSSQFTHTEEGFQKTAASESKPTGTGDKAALEAVFANIDSDSCPTSYNFHMHTVHSDGRLHPKALMAQAIDIGLIGLAITDHHTVGGYYAARSWLETQQLKHPHPTSPLPHLWTGVEINADLLGTEVHILGYAFHPEHLRMQPYIQGKAPTGSDYQAANVIAAIQSAGGLAVLAHPDRYRISGSHLIPEAARLGINGIETYYAYDNPKPWRPSPKQTKAIRKLGQAYGLLHTCGTDTHGLSLLTRL